MINRVHGGSILQDGLIDFSISINPLGAPVGLRQAIATALMKVSRYPEPESNTLKKELSLIHNIRESNLLVGNGSIEFIHLIPRALGINRALIIQPTFSEYEFAAKINGAKIIFVNAREEDDFKIDPTKINRFIQRTNLIILCNPNNPTSAIIKKQDILKILSLCKKYNSILLVDEVFMDFVENTKGLSLLHEACVNKHLLILKSLTKFFAIPGLRLGYLVGHPDLILKLSAFQYPWNVNSLAQGIGRKLIKEHGYIKKSRDFILKERNFLFGSLAKFNTLKPYPPSANFIFCKLLDSKIKDSKQLNRLLMKRGMIIRACDNFRGLDSRFFRLAVKKRKENIKLLEALRDILE